MKIKVMENVEKDVKSVLLQVAVRYWEDATVNGAEDTDGKLMPFRKGDLWCPEIDVETGIIFNWPKGITADIHYKICDEGSYFLKNDHGLVAGIEDDYVPNGLIPGEYGDYIIMTVDENGHINEWPKNPNFDRFF